LILLSGSAVVNEAILTGESQPLVKESIAQKDEGDEILEIKGLHKSHILNSGTEILQHIPSEVNEDLEHLAKVPINDGICCYVLKNGFETKQGKLMRMILFSSDRVTVESAEVYYYLLILLCAALCASYHVCMEGLKDPDRSRYKIMLRCVLIITNVVPPELPMELSLAVNYSIITLIKKQIFCTEPFRIPMAGKVNICCFDKTGTLTVNDLTIKGLTAINLGKSANWTPNKGTVVDNNILLLKDVHSKSKEALIVLGGCHTLAMADGNLVGDPIEK
jgi:cation-transporting ATPase 13A1